MVDELNRHEDEIDLLDLFLRIWRRKYFILGGTAIITLAVLAISMSKPKIYRVRSVLQLGILEFKPEGQTTYTDSVSNLKDIIRSGTFNQKIIENIGLPDGQKRPGGIHFQVPEDDRRARFSRPELQPKTVSVSCETSDAAYGVKALNALGQHLLEYYQSIIDQYRYNIDMRIKAKSRDLEKASHQIESVRNKISGLEVEHRFKIKKTNSEITTIEAQITALESDKKTRHAEFRNKIANMEARKEVTKKQIVDLQQRIVDINKEFGRIRNDSDRLIEERKQFLSANASENNALSTVIYSNTIQQYVNFLNNLRDTINDRKTQIYNRNTEIEELTNSVKDLETQIANIEEQTNYEKAKLIAQIDDLKARRENLDKNLVINTNSLKTEIKDLQTDSNFLTAQIENLNYKKGNMQNIKILKPATLPLFHIKPRIKRNVALAFFGGAFAMLIVALLMEAIGTVKNRREISQTTGEPEFALESEKSRLRLEN